MTEPLPYDVEPPPAAIGDNRPPEDADPLRDRLTETHGALAARQASLLASAAERVPETIEDQETADDVSDFESDLSKCLKALEGTRVAEKEPFLTAERTVDGFFKKLARPLLGAKENTGDVLTIWGRKKRDAERKQRQEEERLAREEAERARQEAEAADRAAMDAQKGTEQALDEAIEAERKAEQAKADLVRAEREAEASAAELSRSRSDKGTGYGLVTFWDYADLNRDTIDLEKLRQHLPEAAIISAVKSFIKAGGQELHGVRIFENTRNRTRGA